MNRKWWGRAGAIVVSCLVGVMGLVVGAAPAHASGGCWSTGCNGLDPHVFGCDTANVYDLEDVTYGSDRLELRYSPDCYAAWVRYTVAPGYTLGGYHCPNHIYLRATDYWGNVISTDYKCMPDFRTDYYQVGWSVMHSFTDWVQLGIDFPVGHYYWLSPRH